MVQIHKQPINKSNIFKEVRNAKTLKIDWIDLSFNSTKLIESFFKILGFVFNEEGRFLGDFKMVIQKEISPEKKNQNQNQNQNKNNNNNNNSNNRNRNNNNYNNSNKKYNNNHNNQEPKKETNWIYKFSLWCMNPAVAFYKIQQEARSVILASGIILFYFLFFIFY